MPLLPGTILSDRYTIEKTIGVGGFGVTYRARDIANGHPVAIKEHFPSYLVQRAPDGSLLLTGDREDYAWTLRHFITEAELLTRLRHPNIIEGLRSFEANNTAYLVMAYAEGTGLNRLNSPLYWTRSSLDRFLRSLLDALSYMHRQGVYHRDIKPANIIMLERSNTPVLLDFGAAKSGLARNRHTYSFVSQGYTPPEQMADSNYLSPGIDIYALGATLYTLLMGVAPPQASARQLRDDIRTLALEPSLRERFSVTLLGSIDRALALDPKLRFRSAEQWAQVLNTAPREQRVRALPQAPPLSDRPATQPTPRSTQPPHAPLRGERVEVRHLRELLVWACNISIATALLLLGCLALSLLGSSSMRHELDTFSPLAIILLSIGLSGRIYLFYNDDFPES